MKFSIKSTFYKSIILILSLLAFSTLSYSQSKNKNISYADKYFKVDDYFLASQYYEKARSQGINNEYIHYQLGECNRLVYKYKNAEAHYRTVVDMGINTFPLANYYYALMLKNNGSYKKSIIEFDIFLKKYPNEDVFKAAAKLEKQGALYILDELQKAQREFHFQNLGKSVNSAESDFAPAIYNHDSSVVFSSARINKKGQELYGRLGGAFLDNYLFEKQNDSIWKNISSLNRFEYLNTSYHDGAGVFTTDKKAFYFTRCDEKVHHNDFHCAIYVSELKDGQWKSAHKLNENVNFPESWNAQPSLNTIGDTLFFASKRKGGKGDSDIWFSVKTGTNSANSWSKATNLTEINTPYTEMNPQYNAKENVLLFATNGRLGFGGLDIYVAKGKDFKNIRNIGLPFNSNNDDFHMVMGDSIGYLSSNRDGGIGNDDIYSFDLYSTSAHLAVLEKSEDKRYDHVDMFGKISGLGNAKIDNLEIIVKDSANQVIKTSKTNSKGEFTIDDINLQDKKEIIISLPIVHLLSEDVLVVDSLAFAIKSSIVQVNPNDTTTIDIGGVVLDKNGKPVVGEKVILLDKEGTELMHTITNKDGEFMFRSLDGDKEYTVKTANNKNAVSNIQVKKNQKGVNTESLDQANKGLASRIKTESIYFDFNATDIRNEAANTLNEIKTLLDKYPNVTLELHGYTDDFGSTAYNIELGEKRGNSALKILESKGVDRSRIQIKTHGESEPVASNLTFEGRQLNRRVDFYVLGGAKYEQKSTIYIMEPGTTLNDVANKYNMTLDELKELNNLSATQTVNDYEPLRVKIKDKNKSNETPETKVKTLAPTAVNYIYKTDANQNKIKYLESSYEGCFVVLNKNTLYSISQITKVDVETIKSLNGLNGNNIFTGQVLQLIAKPILSKADFTEKYSQIFIDNNIEQSIHSGDVFELEGYAKYHVVAGDQFELVAKKFNMTNDELKTINNLSDYTLKQGMVLRVKE